MSGDAPRQNGSHTNDVCVYSIHFPPRPPADQASSISFDEASLQATATSILAYVDELAKDYIWQREPFSLSVTESNAFTIKSPSLSESRLQQYLTGATRVGESVEDEWYIVWLLSEISRKWPDAAIEIKDDDGQFLLIEAADSLPNWVTPDNAENRVWLHSGQLHLVPLAFTSPVPGPTSESNHLDFDTSGHISLFYGLKAVFDTSNFTLASAAVSNAVFSRISHLPGSLAKSHYHRTIAYLPEEICTILSTEPRLISSAITVFYERDALQLKACQFMRRFLPSTSPSSSSSLLNSAPLSSIAASSGPRYASVKMTRALYAQLVSQKFYAPKPFVNARWLESVEEGTLEQRRKDVGMKITCGFEMLYAESVKTSSAGKRVDLKGSNPNDVGNALDIGSMPDRQSYLKYLVALERAGYFQGEVPGSKLYTNLENKAKDYWSRLSKKKEATGAKGFADICDGIVTEANRGQTILAERELSEDSDDWLNIDQAKLEDMLNAREAKPTQVQEIEGEDPHTTVNENLDDSDEDERLANEQAQKLQSMADKFENFVQGEGAIEGATLDDELSDEDDNQDDVNDNDNLDQDIEELVAGPDARNMSLEEKRRRMDKLVPPILPTEWGAAASEAAKLLNSPASPARTAVVLASDGSARDANKERFHSTFHDKHDGVSDDSDSDFDADGNELILGFDGEKESEEDAAQILNDEELKFGQGEMNEFLDFTREALGLSPEQYKDILDSRKKRGAFVPASDSPTNRAAPLPAADSDRRGTRSSTNNLPRSVSNKKCAPARQTTNTTEAAQTRNPKLDSFEALMGAMDAELARVQSTKAASSGTSASIKPSRKSVEGITIHDDMSDSEGDMDDEDVSMSDLDAELAAALKRDPGEAVNGNVDYTMISNFLESFKAQNGLAGPVSNMFGRIDKDFVMPRDQ